MAIEVTFTGWLNDKKEFDWGTVLKMSHSVRRKDEQGDWQTVGKDFIDVIVDKNKMTEFREVLTTDGPARLEVTGNAKPAHYTNKDGEVVTYLKVWPKFIEVEQQGSASQVPAFDETPF